MGRLGKGHKSVDGACHNKKDGRVLLKKGKKSVQDFTKECALKCADPKGQCSEKNGTACMQKKLHGVGHQCTECFGKVIHCTDEECQKDCLDSKKKCDDCTKKKCNPSFVKCSGIDPTSSLGAEMSLALLSTDEGELSPANLDYANASLLPQLAEAVQPDEEEESANSVSEGYQTDNTDMRALLNKRQDQTGKLGEGTLEHACHNKKDGRELQHVGKKKVQELTEECAKDCAGTKGKCSDSAGSHCMEKKLKHISKECNECFGKFVSCTDSHCLRDCLKSKSSCHDCAKKKCQSGFKKCSGINPSSSLGGDEAEAAGAFEQFV